MTATTTDIGRLARLAELYIGAVCTYLESSADDDGRCRWDECSDHLACIDYRRMNKAKGELLDMIIVILKP